MSKRIAALFAALAMALGLAMAPASPAQASYSDCAAYSGTVCFHQHGNFTGTVWRQVTGQIIGCRNLTDFNDRASTAFNSTDDHILYLYEHGNCTGAVLSLSPGDVRSFASTNTWWNDRISSVYLKWVGRAGR